MNLFQSVIDTRYQNSVIATITQFDNATLELQILSDGQVGEAWESPEFELIAMKRDGNSVREVDQDKFTILSKEDHKVQIELKEQFLTYKGSVKMQLVIKDGSRLSTTLFYLVIGQSLDHEIVESHRDVAVLDELEAYVKQGFDDLAYQEERMKAFEQSTNELNATMNANEVERNAAELKRSQIFEMNEINRTQSFNTQVESQRIAFSGAQTQREESFGESQQNMSQEFETSQREREDAFNQAQVLNKNTFDTNEQKRQATFIQSQSSNQQTFNNNESERQHLFETNETGRQNSESQRVQNETERVLSETQRVTAELTRQQKMAEFEEKATQLSEDLDNQVARVDKFVTTNEGKLLGDDDKIDYMGNSHQSVKDANDANVEYILGEVNTVNYEGQHITATDTIEKQVKSAILKGQTLVNLFDKKASEGSFKQWDTISQSRHTLTQGQKVTLKINVLELNGKFELKAFGDGFEDWYWSTSDVGEYSVLITVARDSVFKLRANQNLSCKLEYVLIEGDYTNVDIPYFEGMQSVKMPVLTTSNEDGTKTNILTVNDDVTLRKVGDVQDTLDCLTGKVVERIDEIVMNGSDNENWVLATENGNLKTFRKSHIFKSDANEQEIPNIICDKLKLTTPLKAWAGYGIVPDRPIELSRGSRKNDGFDIIVDCSRATTINGVDSFRQYLSQNPVTVQYELATESIKTVDLSDNHVYSYKDVTHYDCSSAEGSLVPTLSIDVPTNLPAVVTRQRATIQELEKENVALKNEIEETANSSVNGDLELMSSQFELDFRLFEIEMNLDMPMMAMMRGVKSMAMTVYQQAKTLILAGKYERENMEYKLNRYKEAGRITVEEYDELIALMDARELVD